MSDLREEFNVILSEEEKLLDSLTEQQAVLRKCVQEKNWDLLIKTISEINQLSDEFQSFDIRREEIQMELNKEDIKQYFGKLGQVRSKLLKCKIENRVLGDYVNIAKNFIQEVIEKALPQSRNKNYTREGKFVQVQTQSVVLNQLY